MEDLTFGLLSVYRELIKRRIAIKKGAFDLEKEALKASGIKEKTELDEDLCKLGRLCQQFLHQIMPTLDTLTKAKGFFDWFWREKPLRYNPHSYFKLDNVIDAQLGRDSQTARNCLGLTVLYNCLLRGMGIVAVTLYLENAFGIGRHVLIILQTEESLIGIENIFQINSVTKYILTIHQGQDGGIENWLPIFMIVSGMIFLKGEFIKALENYDMALDLIPRYEKAFLNKATLLDKMEMNRKAG